MSIYLLSFLDNSAGWLLGVIIKVIWWFIKLIFTWLCKSFIALPLLIKSVLVVAIVVIIVKAIIYKLRNRQ